MIAGTKAVLPVQAEGTQCSEPSIAMCQGAMNKNPVVAWAE